MLNLYNLFLYLILFIHFITCAERYFYKCKSKFLGEDDDVIQIPSNPLEVDNHIPEDENHPCFSYKQFIISPFKAKDADNVPRGAYNSVAIKCTICKTVARQFEVELKALKHCKLWHTPEEKKMVVYVALQCLCKGGFRKFDLRNFGNNITLTDKFGRSEHIPTELDGHWTIKLREACSKYLAHLNVFNLYNDYVEGMINVEKELCR